MVSTTLLVGVGLDLATACWFVLLASLIHRRLQGHSVMEQTLRWSLLFWYGAAGFMLLDGGYALLALNTDVPRPVQLMVLMLRRLLFVVGTGALVHVLLTMRSGYRSHWPWLAAYYVIVCVVVEAVTLYESPNGHQQLVWSIQFIMTRATPLWLNISIGAAIFVPLGVGSVMALSLYRRLPTRPDRFYLVAFCYAILSFVVGVLAGFVNNSWYWYGLFENRMVFTVAFGMWLVMRPFWWVRRMGVPGLQDLSQFPNALRG